MSLKSIKTRELNEYEAQGVEFPISFEVQFENGYGASVIRNSMSYGHQTGLFEVAVLKGTELCYDTPVTSDVLGWQTFEDVLAVLAQIAALPAEKICECCGQRLPE